MDWRDRLTQLAPGATLAKWAESLLLLLLIFQIARLFWAVVTPLGMVGDWQARRPAVLAPAARQALFAAFDPFFPTETASAGAAQITGLALQLFGTRMNEGSGQGSAIIATPDGMQSSYVAGDQIMPGVVLKQVAYDHVVIDRGGTAENLFLDQSSGSSAPVEGIVRQAGPGAPAQPVTAAAGPLTAEMATRDIAFQPRNDGGRVTGVVISARGGDAFAKAGFEAGDILTQVNGRAITSAADIEGLKAQLKPGARLFVMVERGAATIPVNIVLSGGQ